jgi:hypothetical protein
LGLSINTHHTCDEIKDYYRTKNSATVECIEPTQEEIDNDDDENTVVDSGVTMVVDDGPEPDVIDFGILYDECKTDVTKLACKKIPFALKFECDDCGNKGAPRLLEKCCDKCMAWAKSLKNHEGINEDIHPYVWCSGCNATKIDPVNPKYPSMLWDGAPKYVNYTYEKAYDAVEDFIEKEVCGLLSPECPEATPAATPMPDFVQTSNAPRLLRGLSSEDGSPASEDGASTANGTCLNYMGGNCAAYDKTPARRLSESVDVPPKAPSVMCEAFDFDYYKEAVPEPTPEPSPDKSNEQPATVNEDSTASHESPDATPESPDAAPESPDATPESPDATPDSPDDTPTTEEAGSEPSPHPSPSPVPAMQLPSEADAALYQGPCFSVSISFVYWLLSM